MQIYALDGKGELIAAPNAEKQFEYFCFECGCSLRVRGGAQRRFHFYHTDPKTECFLNCKSQTHISIQYVLQGLLECTLEKSFPEIGRVADCVWHSKNCVIEIQCSFITAKEVRERMRDYAKMGLSVIWVLHDKRFNQYKVTAAEAFLRKYSYFYTNIDEEGKGMIYSQHSQMKGGFRFKRSLRTRIDFRNVKPITFTPPSLLKKFLFSLIKSN